MIQPLIALGNDPQPKHHLWADLAEEYSKDHKNFCKNTKAFTKKYRGKRPIVLDSSEWGQRPQQCIDHLQNRTLEN